MSIALYWAHFYKTHGLSLRDLKQDLAEHHPELVEYSLAAWRAV